MITTATYTNPLYGFAVRVIEPTPKYVLPPDVPPPKGMTREEFAAWSLETCGSHSVIPDDRMLIDNKTQTVYVTPKAWQQLRKSVNNAY